MSYGYGNVQPLRSCGKRHAWCAVCKPDLVKKMMGRKKSAWENYDPDKLAPGYVPHPTKTMWERHTEMHNVDTKQAPPKEEYEPRRYIDLGPLRSTKWPPNTKWQPPLDLMPLEQSIAEVTAGQRSFTNRELRWHFGFTKQMIAQFRREDGARVRWEKLSEEEKKKIEDKRNLHSNREKIILEMVLDGYSTLKDIGDRIGVSRERVRQIVEAIENREGIELPRNHSWKKNDEPVLMVAIRCRYCRKIMEVPDGPLKFREGFCDEHKVSPTIWGFIERGADWYNADENGKERIRYHYDSTRKAKSKIYARLWKEKIRPDPVKWARFKAAEKVAAKKFNDRKKAEREAERKSKIRPFIEVPDNGD